MELDGLPSITFGIAGLRPGRLLALLLRLLLRDRPELRLFELLPFLLLLRLCSPFFDSSPSLSSRGAPLPRRLRLDLLPTEPVKLTSSALSEDRLLLLVRVLPSGASESTESADRCLLFRDRRDLSDRLISDCEDITDVSSDWIELLKLEGSSISEDVDAGFRVPDRGDALVRL